jgi:hypothetical protein
MARTDTRMKKTKAIIHHSAVSMANIDMFLVAVSLAYAATVAVM